MSKRIEIEITPEMIDAGVDAFLSFEYRDLPHTDASLVVREIIEAVLEMNRTD